jgi:hypothetical protein
MKATDYGSHLPASSKFDWNRFDGLGSNMSKTSSDIGYQIGANTANLVANAKKAPQPSSDRDYNSDYADIGHTYKDLSDDVENRQQSKIADISNRAANERQNAIEVLKQGQDIAYSRSMSDGLFGQAQDSNTRQQIFGMQQTGELAAHNRQQALRGPEIQSEQFMQGRQLDTQKGIADNQMATQLEQIATQREKNQLDYGLGLYNSTMQGLSSAMSAGNGAWRYW